jgi:uncharacterized membrane protein
MMTHTVEKVVDVAVPVHIAYNQWTQFEEFPCFMKGVLEVRQLDERRLRWRAAIFGRPVEWTAEITQQVPDRRIAWRSLFGARNSGMVSFRSLTRTCTRVTLRMTVQPRKGVESAATALGLVAARVGRDLERFRIFIEARGGETGRWRGEIQGLVVIPATHARRG